MKKVILLLLLVVFYFQKYEYVDLSHYQSEEIQVEIKGEVNHANTYTLPYQSKVKDLIKKASGTTNNADTSQINMNQLLHNNDVIVVKPKQQVQLISLNSASIEELSTLNGVGPSTAQKIIDYRKLNGSFQKIEDIMNVKGIKEKLFSKIKDFITL